MQGLEGCGKPAVSTAYAVAKTVVATKTASIQGSRVDILLHANGTALCCQLQLMVLARPMYRLLAHTRIMTRVTKS
jgi:hypothetical protein